MEWILDTLFLSRATSSLIMTRHWSVRAEGALEPAGHCLRHHVSGIRRGAREVTEQE